MRKEIIFAIISGILFGLVIAFGIWRANNALNTDENAATDTSDEFPTEQVPSDQTLSLNILKPQDFEVVSEVEVPVLGIAEPGSWIVISTDEYDIITQPKESGSFEETVELNTGVNFINILSFPTNTATQKTELTVVYSSTFEKFISSGSDEATSSSDTIEEKVRKKIEFEKIDPKAVIGKVTDVLENSLQLETEQGEIALVSIDNEISEYSNIINSPKEVAFEDIAIGDYVIAMGYKNENGVLSALRILISEAIKKPVIRIIKGSVSEINSKEVTIAIDENNSETVSFGRRWVGPEINELEEQDPVIVTLAEDDEGNFLVRTLATLNDDAEGE